MKNIIKGLSLVLVVSTVGFMNGQHKDHKNVSVTAETSTEFIPAIRLINNPDGSCTFEKGKIPTLKHMNTTTFWMSNKTEEWEKMPILLPEDSMLLPLKEISDLK